MSAPADWEGRSLVGACAGAQADAAAAGRAIFSMNFEQNPRFGALKTGSVAVIQGRWKLIHYMGALHYPFMPALHDELYDVIADPGSRTNLAAQQPALVQRLRGLIDCGSGAARRAGDARRYAALTPPEQSASLPQTAANLRRRSAGAA